MRETISEGLKTALKARDQRRTATLRAINAAIKDRDIANRGDGKGPATNDEVLAMIQKMVKQREESFAIYAQAGRADLATVEKEEIDILNEFLPKPLTEEEVAAAITAAISSSGAEGPKDMGKVIAELKANYPGRIDFGKVSQQVRSALAAQG
ncbi:MULTISPECIES: GatB/YqeY domain-containing protein [unclassified Devosia]|uniref:GatB/YqeY domain-containing protein n=1 Tax=unclassified Devosia TaxID=196773 RepID=UPI0007140F09|nr:MULTISPECIES: GatB/YqeY domain-containing protein [unclassified Devosia]KQN69982.1 glutamyl-tRNA amidotransferase [Devosia sp. Leaf64]KQT46103.1 glutamyl-tRNA amidotransferase [Devosia sp. Leaf420]